MSLIIEQTLGTELMPQDQQGATIVTVQNILILLTYARKLNNNNEFIAE